MAISMAQLVKELRARTGAGMMDCKKALEATNNEMEAAIDWLRENGIAKAAKKGDRVAAEGLTSVLVEGNKAVIFELNSETDFVSKNEQFLVLLNQVGTVLVNSDVESLEDALALEVDGDTLAALIDRGTATIGEKINLRRFITVTKSESQIFSSYAHMGGRISALALAEGSDDATLKNICMHIAASKPQFLNRESVQADVIEKEREMLLIEAIREQIFKVVLKEEQIKPINLTPEREGQVNAIVDTRFAEIFEARKDEEMIQKIVTGKVNKFLKEMCLVDQSFVMNPDQTVGQVATAANLDVVSYTRFEVGEGIVKEEVDFAAEVAAQLRG